MANAEIALKAAKDLNADSLVPELYRGAADNFFKAKRDYRLKNFEMAKAHALRATRLAEQAEFEAYRMGGATPEASAKAASPEGASADVEEALKPDLSPDEPTLPPPANPSGGTSSAPAEKGMDYDELLRQKEAEREAAEKEKEQKEKDKKPSGASGPRGLCSVWRIVSAAKAGQAAATSSELVEKSSTYRRGYASLFSTSSSLSRSLPSFLATKLSAKQSLGATGPSGTPTPVPTPNATPTPGAPADVTFPTGAAPQTGGIPPTSAGTPSGLNTRTTPDTNNLTPAKGSEPPFVNLEPAEPMRPGFQPLDGKPFQALGTTEDGKARRIESLGTLQNPVQQGLDPVEGGSFQDTVSTGGFGSLYGSGPNSKGNEK